MSEESTIHPQYISNLLEEIKKLDPKAAEELLLLKVSVNDNLLKHPTIHFYDDKLTIFGALAGMASESAEYKPGHAPAKPIIDFFNNVLSLDPNAIKELIFKRVSVNWDIANHKDIITVVEADTDGNPTNPKLGFLGVLNGLVGGENEWGRIGIEIDDNGFPNRFLTPPETLKTEDE